MKIHDSIIQGSEEWFALRLARFTASDAQAIASNGAGLTTLVYEKAAEKLTGKTKDSYSNDDMLRGKELEALARSAYEIESGQAVKTTGFIELNEFAGASPDGLLGEKGLLEIKNPNAANFVKFMYERKIDTKYKWQTQMQLYVSGREWVDFVVHHPDFQKPLIITRIERDPEAIKKIEIGLSQGIAKLREILAKV